MALNPDSEMQENQLWSLRNKHTRPNTPKQIWPCVKTGHLESSTNDPDFTARAERRCETENKISKDLSAFSSLSLGQYAITVSRAPWHLRSVHKELVEQNGRDGRPRRRNLITVGRSCPTM